MTPQLSILLGSGFSIPERLPRVSEINDKFCNLEKDNFSQYPANGYSKIYQNSNVGFSNYDKSFAERFTSFYIEKTLNGDTSKFDYERFYDYISEFLFFNINTEQISEFCQIYRNSLPVMSGSWTDYDLINSFKRIFNHIVAELLFVTRYFNEGGFSDYPQYNQFIDFLEKTLVSKFINVHTLNHDLFFEYIGNMHTGLGQYFTDGFTECGSPYYGEVPFNFELSNDKITKTYRVRLPFYNGIYQNKLRLFKLHGSINYINLRLTKTNEIIKIKTNFGVQGYFSETYNPETQSYNYSDSFCDYNPDYLTGETEKIRQYNNPFYDTILSHFKKNLQNSNHLIVIGYGFHDRAINEFIENNLLLYPNKKLTIVGISKPDTIFFKKYPNQINFIDKGVIGLTLPEWLNIVQ